MSACASNHIRPSVSLRGQFPSLQDFHNLNAEVFAGMAYLGQVFQRLAGVRHVLRSLYTQIPQVSHFIAELRHALIKTRYAHRRRAYINAVQPAAEPQGNAHDADASFQPRTRFSRTCRLFYESFVHK
jgi:hypothetical protein